MLQPNIGYWSIFTKLEDDFILHDCFFVMYIARAEGVVQ